ncbi:MAG: CAP domain-containing protein [Tagaea sp.]
MRALALAALMIVASPVLADEAALEAAMAAARREAGLAVAAPDARLARAARAIAEDNAARGTLDHTDANGGTLRGRTLAAGYVFRFVAENLAAGTPEGARVASLWLDSPAHRANMLSVEAAHYGLARVRGADGRDYWATVFAAPLR